MTAEEAENELLRKIISVLVDAVAGGEVVITIRELTEAGAISIEQSGAGRDDTVTITVVQEDT